LDQNQQERKMKYPLTHLTATALAGLLICQSQAAPLVVTVEKTPAANTEGYRMGESRQPDGTTLTLDSHSLRLDGQPWTPVMGEFHYSRVPANEWREELLKMKAGGVDIVSTYVFWIHHEEIEGKWDWSGCRNLRQFIQTCGQVGLKVVVRCGPWCHGEVRNGGQPDWLLQKGWHLRSNDPRYLAKVRILDGQIAQQLAGLLWKDGGPVIGCQFENEYSGPAEHLLKLKQLGREAGLDVPIYTKTGWPELRTPLPFGELIPLYGVYTEGFWDREITPMPGNYWAGFHFSNLRLDSNIASDAFGRHKTEDAPDVTRYPYLTCEIGGGMMNSYHRRILIDPADIESATLVKIGSGSVSPGYYMYHGGENPDGQLTTLQESQATGYWNDMPVKNYDFQAPLGEYGQINPQYALLRRLHLFLHEWGGSLAGMGVDLPDQRPLSKEDTDTLRWSVRSDGDSGFVFVNNYERLRDLPAKSNVQFAIKLPSGTQVFPQNPVTIPADSRFFWPFNLDLGKGVKLISAAAQPVTAIDDGDLRVVFFAETKGIPTEFVFGKGVSVKPFSGTISAAGDDQVAIGVEPDRKPALEITTPTGRLQVVLLNSEDSLALWKGKWLGRDRVFLTKAGLVLDDENLRLTATDREEFNLGIYPPPEAILCNGKALRPISDGVFASFTPPRPEALDLKATAEMIQAAGPPRKIPLGKINQPVAAAPEDSDFNQATVWRIKLPDNFNPGVDPLLRIKYIGDVARVTLNGKLLVDDFYNGKPFEVGLCRYAPGILSGDLRLSVLPLQKDAPIYLAKSARPQFGTTNSMAVLREIEIIPRYTVALTSKAEVSQAAN
jgi:beta-galactosidase